MNKITEKQPLEKSGPQKSDARIEIHGRHHKLVVRDVKTGQYIKKPKNH